MRNKMKKIWPYIFVAPAFIHILIFRVYPTIQTLFLSLTDSQKLNNASFTLTNFKGLFNPNFLEVFFNTIYYVSGGLFLVAPGALLIAILLDKGKGQGFFRSVYFYPFTVVMVAAGIIWGYGFRVDGFINKIIGIFGISSKVWLGGSGKLAMPALIFTTVWRFVGYFAVIYLSGLQSIPKYLYDAAIVDGANPIQTFWHVTIPQLKPITLFIFVMSSINLLRQFAIPKVMTNGGPYNQTNVLSLEIYKQAFTYFNINQAAAGTIILIILATCFSIIQFKISKGMRG